MFLEHTLLIADFMVCLEIACRQAGNIRLIDPEEIIGQAPKSAQRRHNPSGFRIGTVDNSKGRKRKIQIGLIPDKLFGLQFLDKPKGRDRAYFFLEADRSTMPVKRKNPYSRTSIYKKLLGYYIASPMRDNVFEKVYGFKHARVLTVTTTQDRIKTMIEANKEVDQRHKGIGMFLFTTKDSLKLADPIKILKDIWVNGREEQTNLFC